MHVDSKSLHNDMGAICSRSPSVSHTHAHICSGNKHAKHALLLCLIVWRHGGRELSISQTASLKVPESITVLYSQRGKHTHIHTQRLSIGKKRPGRLGWRWISGDDTQWCGFAATIGTHIQYHQVMHSVTWLLYVPSSQVSVHCCCAINSSNRDYVGVDVKAWHQRKERDTRQADGNINKDLIRRDVIEIIAETWRGLSTDG